MRASILALLALVAAPAAGETYARCFYDAGSITYGLMGPPEVIEGSVRFWSDSTLTIQTIGPCMFRWEAPNDSDFGRNYSGLMVCNHPSTGAALYEGNAYNLQVLHSAYLWYDPLEGANYVATVPCIRYDFGNPFSRSFGELGDW